MSSKKEKRIISNQLKKYNDDSKISNDYSKSKNKNKKINNETNDILENILDNKKKFNIYSPSQLKQMTEQIKIIETQKKLDNNLDFNKKNLYSIKEDEKNNIYLIESISKCLLQINKTNPKFMEMNLHNKILFIINFITNDDLKIKLGAVILEYFLLKNNFDQINFNIKIELLKNILNYLHNSYESQEELFLVSCLNILSLYNSSYEYLIDSISLIAMFLTDFDYPYLQRASFICLINLGKIGLETLINIAIKEEYQDYQKYILNSLIKTPFIQRVCLIKSLINEIKSNDINRRLQALSALNRFYDILDKNDFFLQDLSNIFSDDKYKNYFIYLASILRCSGKNGIYYLIENLEKSENSKKREIICKTLGYQINNPEYLEIILDNNDIKSNNFIEIGKLWKYYGDISPVLCDNNNLNKNNFDEDDLDSVENMYDININNNNENKNNFLLISTRDFLTCLQRLMKENLNWDDFDIINKNEKKNILDELNLSILYDKDNKNDIKKEEFKLKLIDSINQKINISIFKKYKSILINQDTIEDFQESNSINKNIIKYLCYHLNDYSENVRFACSISLGRLAKNELDLTIKEITKVINIEKNISVLSSMLWALGKNLTPSYVEIIPILIKYIQSDIWKIKRCALFALAKFGSIASQALPILIKLLLESPINKTIIAEVIISLGNEGENKLIEIIKKEEKNIKLISCIIKSFSYINLNSNNIDIIIQYLCQQLYNNSSFIIRQNCLFSLRKLSNRLKQYNNCINISENNKYIYLTEKNIIPLFYEKLKDKEFKIQKYAIDSLLEFGPKGELIFLEGLLKDKSPIVRLNCAIGLCLSGVHTFRTLINKGLFDSNKSVRLNIQRAILHFFSVENIIKFFEKKGQLMSLKILLDEYLEKGEDITENFLKFSQILLGQIDNLSNNL